MNRRVIVEADGGSRGNPGPAGCGAVVRDADSGAVLAERSVALGETTNNVAEYQGLLVGLDAAAQLDAGEVRVRMDSKLVIEQMTGRWRIKHAALRELAGSAEQRVRGFREVSFEWIPRASNAHADRLANEAMDEQASAVGGRENATAADRSSQPLAWNGAMGPPTRLVLVRHGQTHLSVDRRYSGRGDVALTGLGQQQANAVAQRLAAAEGADAVAVLASPLQRAQQTARAVADVVGLDVSPHDGLVETDFGAWEGLTFSEAAQQYERLHASWLGDPTVEPPGGESLEAVYARVSALCAEVVSRYAGKTVVVVSHVTPIKAVLRLALDVGPSLFYRLHLDLASLSVVDFYADGNASVRLVNETSHLG